MRLFKNKKGNDMMYLIMIILVMVILAPILSYVLNEVSTVLNADPNVQPESAHITNNLNNSFSEDIDMVVFLIIIALYLGAIIVALVLDVHPLFLVGAVLFMILLMWMGGMFANTYVDYISDPSSTIGQEIDAHFPITKFYMNHFLEINLGFFIIYLILLYSKTRQYL